MSSKGQKNKSKQIKSEAVSDPSDIVIAKDKIESKSADKKSLVKKTEIKKSTDGIFLKRFIQHAGNFLREAKFELQKVKWPTKKELITSTIVVVVLSVLVGCYLGILDFGLVKLIALVIG